MPTGQFEAYNHGTGAPFLLAEDFPSLLSHFLNVTECRRSAYASQLFVKETHYARRDYRPITLYLPQAIECSDLSHKLGIINKSL
jgi:hypothetical protein